MVRKSYRKGLRTTFVVLRRQVNWQRLEPIMEFWMPGPQAFCKCAATLGDRQEPSRHTGVVHNSLENSPKPLYLDGFCSYTGQLAAFVFCRQATSQLSPAVSCSNPFTRETARTSRDLTGMSDRVSAYTPGTNTLLPPEIERPEAA
jgi:hypothetical protein